MSTIGMKCFDKLPKSNFQMEGLEKIWNIKDSKAAKKWSKSFSKQEKLLNYKTGCE